MSREIKFRAWSESLKKFSKPFTLKATVLNFTNDDGLGTIKSLEDEVIQQYVGYKDINGKEIYEGDIIKALIEDVIHPQDALKMKSEKFITSSIYWDSYYCGLETDFNCFSFGISEKTVEVIGNIYETPELLQS